VTSVLGGCALREVYERGDGLLGESLSLYDASHRRWHQSWFTNRGGPLPLEGDRMVPTRPARWNSPATPA
jgi:hypothetical protein